jgi:hypothetical protein
MAVNKALLKVTHIELEKILLMTPGHRKQRRTKDTERDKTEEMTGKKG